MLVCLRSSDQQSNGPLLPPSCVHAGVERVMVNPLPVELEDGVANLHAVALGLTTFIHNHDLGSAGVRPEGIYAQSSSSKIVRHRSRGQ